MKAMHATTVVILVITDMVTLPMIFLGFFLIALMRQSLESTSLDLAALVLSNTALGQKASTGRPETNQVRAAFFQISFPLRIANRRMTNQTEEVYTDNYSHEHFSAFQLSDASKRTAHTLTSFMAKYFHQVILSYLPFLSATETTSTTWTSCDHVAHLLLCVNSALPGGMNIPHSNTRLETLRLL